MKKVKRKLTEYFNFSKPICLMLHKLFIQNINIAFSRFQFSDYDLNCLAENVMSHETEIVLSEIAGLIRKLYGFSFR